jgi:Tol biopolymer transport system component
MNRILVLLTILLVLSGCKASSPGTGAEQPAMPSAEPAVSPDVGTSAGGNLLMSSIALSADDSQLAIIAYTHPDNYPIYANESRLYVAQMADRRSRLLQSWPGDGIGVRFDIGANPRFSPDSALIYYVVDTKDELTMPIATLYAFSLADATVHNVFSSNYGMFEGGPTARGDLSPDGQTLYTIASSEYQQPDIFSVRIEGMRDEILPGSAMTQRTNLSAMALEALLGSRMPSLSADGRSLAFMAFDRTSREASLYKLVIMDVQSGGLRLYTNPPFSSLAPVPILSPDGKSVLYVGPTSAETGIGYAGELFLFDLEANASTQVTDLASDVASPLFFHNQNKILFLKNSRFNLTAVLNGTSLFVGTYDQIWEVNTDGSGLRQVNLQLS